MYAFTVITESSTLAIHILTLFYVSYMQSTFYFFGFAQQQIQLHLQAEFLHCRVLPSYERTAFCLLLLHSSRSQTTV